MMISSLIIEINKVGESMNGMVSVKEGKRNLISHNVVDFLNPDYVYIPILEDFSIEIETNSQVFKEEVMLRKGSKLVYAPISGTVIGATESMRVNDREVRCVVIANDFREKVNHKKSAMKYINEYVKEDFIELIKKYNAYEGDIPEDIKVLVVNGIDPDPFEKTASFIIDNHSSQILETIDAISSILKLDTTILAINNNDSENVINLTNNIGTYPNITLRLVPDIYPIGFKEVLVKSILTKKQEKGGYLYLSAQEIYTIYNVLKRNKPITERLVTVGGNAIDKSFVVNVKIGTSLSDIIKNCCNIVNDDYYVIVNGLIAGKTLSTLNNVITTETRSIFLNTKDTQKEKKCINCGLCNSKCPVGLNPKYLKDHKRADRSKCIHCGLCTYICPSKINFKPYLGGNDE